MQMHAHVQEFMCDPQHFDTCVAMIQQHQKTNGIPPSLEALGMSIWRNTERETSPVAAVTDSGVVSSSGKKAAKKRRRMRTKQAESAAKTGGWAATKQPPKRKQAPGSLGRVRGDKAAPVADASAAQVVATGSQEALPCQGVGGDATI